MTGLLDPNLGERMAEAKARQVEAMRDHVQALAREHGIHVEIYKGAGRAYPGERRIQIQPVAGVSSYFTALHEIGHVVGRGRSARKLDAEANAWQFALDNANRLPTPTVRRMIAKSLRSYLAAGRRDSGLRQGMIEPPAGHVFWKLANPRGLTRAGLDRVEPRS
jgi:hypothetical protein